MNTYTFSSFLFFGECTCDVTDIACHKPQIRSIFKEEVQLLLENMVVNLDLLNLEI